MADNNRSEFAKISIREKLAYGAGDFGGGIFFYVALTLSAFFYTDVIGMPATLVGTIMVFSRLLDGITDCTLGILVDKTRTKWGKARPWIIFTTVPYAVSLILLYTIPANATLVQQGVYLFITYNFAVTICFTAMNLPYGLLASLMTRDKDERAITIVYRMTASPIGGLFSLALALPLINLLGGDQRAWIIVMSIFAAVCIICNYITVFNCIERVKIDPEAGKDKIKTSRSVRAAVTNPYWWVMLALFALYGFYLNAGATTVSYYCKYILGNTLYLGHISVAEKLMTAAASVTCGLLVRKMYKCTIIKIGMILVVPAQICLLFGTPSLTLVVITSLIKGLGWGFFGGLIYGMLADEIEYGHWRTGVRTEGMTFIASGIGTKIGIALGGGGVSIVMGMAGYDGTVAVQSASAQSMISNLFVYLPLITSLLVFVILLFYVIDKQYDSIMADLAEGRFYKSQAQQSILSAAVKINT